jgi:H+-transporting ATPase
LIFRQILCLVVGDYLDFGMIVGLLVVNSTFAYRETRQSKIKNKILKAERAPRVQVKRNGSCKVINAQELVPGGILLCVLFFVAFKLFDEM